ncbi:MAG: hypothetical protein ACTTHG_02250 [Treponemataceae bacterium]
MNTSQIFINAGKSWFEFSKSKTGQLDYIGRWEENKSFEQKFSAPDVTDWQQISSSTYFSPSRYIFLDESINNNPKVYVDPQIDISDAEVFAFLTHVGALISAVDAKDSLLAGELYLGKRDIFEKFSQVTQFIMKELSVEILFSLCFGKMNQEDPLSIPLVYNNAAEKLEFDPARESLEQALTRYFKQNTLTLTMQVVGTNYYNWNREPKILQNFAKKLEYENFADQAKKIRAAKHDFYGGLETVIQAEPYNPYDKNAITVCLETIEAKICGNCGIEKTGHIRAKGAKIIREAKQQKLNYLGKLFRLGNKDIVIQMTI